MKNKLFNFLLFEKWMSKNEFISPLRFSGHTIRESKESSGGCKAAFQQTPGSKHQPQWQQKGRQHRKTTKNTQKYEASKRIEW